VNAPRSYPRWPRLRDRLGREEEGFTIVIVVLLLAVTLAAGAAALAETLAARDSANLTGRSAKALQAADAGIQTELYRTNQLNLGSLKLTNGGTLASSIGQFLTCPIPQVNGSGQITGITFTAIASVGAACPANGNAGTGNPLSNKEPVGNHAYYDVRFIPGTTSVGDFVEFSPKIVALGIDDGGVSSPATVYRRVEAILAPIAPWRTLEASNALTFNVPPVLSVSGLGALVTSPGATVFNGTAAAGGDLTIQGQGGLASVNTFTASNISLSGGATTPSALDYCGNLKDGAAQNMSVVLTAGSITKPSSGCSSLVSRPTISISSAKANCAPDTGTVACSTLFNSTIYPNTTTSGGSPDSIYCTSSCPTLTFQPGDYVFCDFQYNGHVNLNPSSLQAVRIFIDSPSSSRCSTHGSHASSALGGFQTTYGNFVAEDGVGNLLGTTHPSQAQVYVVGTGTTAPRTVAYSTGDTTLSSQDMFLYAPTSDVTVTGGESCVTILLTTTCANTGTLAGAFVGYNVTASATAITEDLGLLNYPLSTSLGPFYVKQYIECPVETQATFDVTANDPSSGC
jgi:hypothetical protein